jgi:hypothetical protein
VDHLTVELGVLTTEGWAKMTRLNWSVKLDERLELAPPPVMLIEVITVSRGNA